jgi:gamma-glutamylputrescine oxidase
MELLTQQHGLDNDFQRHGHLTPASSRRASLALHADLEVMRTTFGDNTARLMDASEVAQVTGTQVYQDGYFDPRSAGVHPYKHAVALARAVAAGGTSIYGDSPVVSVEQDGAGFTVRTPQATVRATKLVYATNGYTDLYPLHGELARSIVAVSSAVIATEVLSADLAARILPGGTLVTDTRHLVNYFRKTPCGRLLFGGRGSLTGKESSDTYVGLERRLVETFPPLRGMGIAYRWSGRVAISMDDFPHIGARDGRAFFALGYGGRGVMLSHVLGTRLADCVLGKPAALGPMSDGAFKPIPLHAFRIPGMNVVAGYYKFKDALGR